MEGDPRCGREAEGLLYRRGETTMGCEILSDGGVMSASA